MNLGELIDQRAALKTAKAIAQQAVDRIDDEQKELDRLIIAAMVEGDLKMAAGSTAKVVLKEEQMPTAKDWEALFRHIGSTGKFYLLQKRLAATAMREELASGEAVPGVEMAPVRSLSLTSL